VIYLYMRPAGVDGGQEKSQEKYEINHKREDGECNCFI
jgi:hypothetical protein